MRAISCTSPGQLELVAIDRPELRSGWVRVGIRHIGICGTDYHIFEGSHPFLQYPRIMGHAQLVERIAQRGGVEFGGARHVLVLNIAHLHCSSICS